MNDLVRFDFQGNQVRTIMIDGEPWWIAKDVCSILSISDTTQACERLDDDEKLVRTLYVSGQNREIWTVNESGLYTLILRSNKPEAKTFKRWITHEVIPQIRKTGGYGKAAIDYTELATAVASAVTAAMTPLMRELRSPVLPIRYSQTTLALPAATPDGEYYTIKGYGSMHGVTVNNTNAVMLGREASRLSRQQNIDIHKIPDEKWGEVNSYYISVLKEVFTV